MGLRKPAFTKYEAVILLDGYLDALSGRLSRQASVRRVSKDLRTLAINQGISIDESYRNVNGITFQMSRMESAYQGQTISISRTKLFDEIVSLYRNNRQEYETILKEAIKMAAERSSVKENFKNYLTAKVGSQKVKSFFWCYKEIEDFCLKIHILDKPLFETTDLQSILRVQKAIENYKTFRATHRKYDIIVEAGRYYYEYIKEEHFTSPEENSLSNQVEKHTINSSDSPNNETNNNVSQNDEILENPIQIDEIDNKEMIPSKDELFIRTEQDDRLVHKYPIIYKRVFVALKALSIIQPEGVSIDRIYNHINRIGRCADIENILDNASWSMTKGETYLFSNNIELHNDLSKINSVSSLENDGKNAEVKNSTIKIIDELEENTIDFNNIGNLSFTTPIKFSYFGNVFDCNIWREIYVTFVSLLYKDNADLFRSGSTFFWNGERKIFGTESDKERMLAPKPIPGTNLYLETNLNANDIVSRIKTLLDYCHVDYKNVVLIYKRKAISSPTDQRTNTVNATKSEASVIGERLFADYLKNTLHLSGSTSRGYASAIRGCERFALEHEYSIFQIYGIDPQKARSNLNIILNDPEFISFNRDQHNRFKVAIAKYEQFLDANEEATEINDTSIADKVHNNEEYESVLEKYFSKGFRLDSAIEIKRFRKCFESIHEKQLEDSDDQIEQTIKGMSLIYENRAYLPKMMLSPEVKEKLFAFIKENFNDGKKSIYFQAIFSAFSSEFLDCHIYDADMLRIYLTQVNDGSFYVKKNSITLDPWDSATPQDEIRAYLKQSDKPVTYEELYNALPHLPKEKIRQVLGMNTEFVNNGVGCYFHQSCLRVTEEEMENISKIINSVIQEKKFISGTELYQDVKAKYPYIMDNNTEISIYGFRDAIKYRLKEQFSFNGNIISRKGEALTMQDVFADFCKSKDSFTLNELSTLAKEMGSPIYFNPVYDNSLRISETEFVSKDRAQFHIEESDDAIDRICTGKYIGIKKIQDFVVFPEAGFPWNGYLLQHFVYAYSNRYKLVHNGFNAYSFDGAIVKRNAGIDTFDDLLIDALVRSNITLSKEQALEFLQNEGYITRRRYTPIEQIIIRAKALRNHKGV
jgi:hypothetical protein